MRIAFRDAWLVRVVPSGKTDLRDASQLAIVEVGDRNVQTVDLRESDLAFVERLGDALALPKQQIAISPFHERAFLQRVSAVALDAAKAARGATDEDAIGP